MRGLVDLHCHYIPGVDDGVRTLEDSRALLEGLARIGFEKVVATPHIRTAMFENRKAPLEASYAALTRELTGAALPQLGLAAEHYFDDIFWQLFQASEVLPYPGGNAALIEFSYDAIPLRIEHRFFEMNVKGIRPVLAHPERYSPLYQKTDPLDPLLDVGVLALLDVMSLTGKYGRSPKHAAERMLDEGVYYAACSDSHKPSDVAIVEEAIGILVDLVGEEEAHELFSTNPKRILDGTAEP